MSKINIFLFFLLIPAIVAGLLLYNFDSYSESYLSKVENYISDNSINEINDIGKVDINTKSINDSIESITDNLVSNTNFYNQYINEIPTLYSNIDSLSSESLITYDKIIDYTLGEPVYSNISENNKINIYKINNGTYQGFVAKIKLFNKDSFKLKLANDELGTARPVSQIAKDNDALLGINAGGFYKKIVNKEPYTQMIGVTFSEGKLVSSSPANEDGFFVAGVNSNGELEGSRIDTSVDFDKINIENGASFLPILLEDKSKKNIPGPWKNTRHPRTVIGNFANEDLFILVIDGRQNNHSKGITLENLQDKLINFGVMDAYNLDGGGSSTLYYDGEVLNQPSDGYERYVPNAFLLFK